jgi:hypothetical protein
MQALFKPIACSVICSIVNQTGFMPSVLYRHWPMLTCWRHELLLYCGHVFTTAVTDLADLESQDVVAPTYARVLSELAGISTSGTGFYSAWPSSMPAAPWSEVVVQLYARLDGPVVHSPVNGGRWMRPTDAIYIDEACQRYECPRTG